MSDSKLEYRAHSQWAGWWGGYGSEPLLQQELNTFAAQGWRVSSTKVDKFVWFGISLWPPAIIAYRTKILYIFEREIIPGRPSTDPTASP